MGPGSSDFEFSTSHHGIPAKGPDIKKNLEYLRFTSKWYFTGSVVENQNLREPIRGALGIQLCKSMVDLFYGG
jgi:hypothetical protein